MARKAKVNSEDRPQAKFDAAAVKQAEPEKPKEELAVEDPYARYRLPQDFGTRVAVKTEQMAIRVHKPDKQTFFRVNPDPHYALEAMVLVFKEEGETYLVDTELVGRLLPELTCQHFYVCVDRQNNCFLWGVNFNTGNKLADMWAESATRAAEQAMTTWIRIRANMTSSCYDVSTSEALHNIDPIFPTKPMYALLDLAFKNMKIDTMDHPVLRKLGLA